MLGRRSKWPLQAPPGVVSLNSLQYKCFFSSAGDDFAPELFNQTRKLIGRDKRKTAKALLAALLVLGLACPALAGWQITESADGETSKLFFQQGQVREQIKQLPPEQRAAAMAAMPGVMGKSGQPRPKVLVKKTGQSETIAGFPAQKHEIWVNGSLREELWIAPKITLTQELDPKKLKEAMASAAMA